MNNSSQQQFPGFPKEPATNYWPYPRVLNGWWHILTGSEQKVLDYILRHTWGFNKTCDFISYRQFQFGIKKRSGEWLDRGCGIKHRITLKNAIGGLTRKGFLEAIVIQGKTSWFKLRWSESEPLVQGMNITGSESEPVSGSKNEPTIKDSTIKDLPIKEMSASLRSAGPPSSLKAQPPSEASPDDIEAKVHKVIDFFYKACIEMKGFKPRVSLSKEGPMIKNFLQEYSVDELEQELDWFLGSKDSDELGCTIKIALCNHVFNKWLAQRGIY